jgi:antitoxin component of MazEF toxin-antitoxin module
MLKKLTRHGNSLALVIDRPILDLLGIDADTPLHITTDGKGLHIEPAVEGEDHAPAFAQALEHANERHSEVLRRLAESSTEP